MFMKNFKSGDTMNKVIILYQFFYIYLTNVNSESNTNENVKGKKFIPYFRRQVEEIEDKNLLEKDDPNSNFVSFIVNNVKEIFDDDLEKSEIRPIKVNTTTEIYTETTSTTTLKPTATAGPTTVFLRPTVNVTETTTFSTSVHPTRTDVIIYENLTLSTLIEDLPTLAGGLYGINSKSPKLIAKDIKFVGRADKKDRKVNLIARVFPNSFFNANNLSEADAEQDPRRSCIMCNNVEAEDCNDPKNKL